LKQFVKNLFHEPLFQFLLIGAALFLLSGLFGNSDQPQSGQTGQPSFKIIITPGQIEHLKAQFKRTWQRPPTAQELKGLIDNHVLDEISYREATALGLDRDDPTIRSRMRLKLETLNEDIAAATAATDQDLQAFLEQHPDAFRRKPQVAFRQVYLNPDRRANVEADARALLAQLQAAGPETDLAGFGDSLMVATNAGSRIHEPGCLRNCTGGGLQFRACRCIDGSGAPLCKGQRDFPAGAPLHGVAAISAGCKRPGHNRVGCCAHDRGGNELRPLR